MATTSFKDLIVWQQAQRLVVEVYSVTAAMNDYGFKDQLQRASVSIANNIAEGRARRSDKSFRQPLLIAKGSAAEVESMILLATELQYISSDQKDRLIESVEQVSRLLNGLIKKLSALSP
jgi:four helix bundle protein